MSIVQNISTKSTPVNGSEIVRHREKWAAWLIHFAKEEISNRY